MTTAQRDQYLSALAYILSPVVGFLILVSEPVKHNLILRRHAVQGLALAVVLGGAILLLQVLGSLGVCLSPFVWFVPLTYYGYQAYQGQDVTIPYLTDFCKRQGWF